LTGFRRIQGARIETPDHENPVFMQLLRTLPMVTMRLRGGESQAKSPISTGFYGSNACFSGFLAVLAGFQPPGTAKSLI
jgi:hypothetical protein